MIFDSNIVDWILVINPEFQYVFKLKKLYIYLFIRKNKTTDDKDYREN